LSVAFRRDSDEEHLEPRFEIPIPPGPNLVTPAGFAETRQRVSELETLVATVTDELRLAEVQRDLRYWRTRLSTAQLAPAPPTDRVAFGSHVTFRLKGATRAIVIVGDDESDPATSKIGFSAPLARAMLGADLGEFVDFAGEAEAIAILEIGQSFA
jgi:transcription elongation GreA/GreB family factor